MSQRLYTLFQVADLLGSTLGEVESWISKGWLPCRQMPEGSVRVSEEGLVRFLESQGIDLGEVMSRIAQSEAIPSAPDPAADTPVEKDEHGPDESDHRQPPAIVVHPHLPEVTPPAWADSPRPSPALPAPTAPRAIPPDPDPAQDPQPVAEDKPADEADVPDAEPEPQPVAEETAEPPTTEAVDVVTVDPAVGAGVKETASAEIAEHAPAPEAVASQAVEQDQGDASAKDSPADDIPSDTVPAEDGPAEEEPVEVSPRDPVRQVIETVLDGALDRQASHIHLVSDREGLSLRLRIDGVLQDKSSFRRHLPAGLGPAVMAELLSAAGVDAAETRRPMRGVFSRTAGDRDVEFVLDTTPTIQGRRVVIHVHDPRRSLPGLTELGLSSADRSRLESLLSAQAGLVMVAGPPRSGRMTTLRALAMALREMERDVVTVERSAEVIVPGVCRSVADACAGFSCAEAIDALARQDPDVIVVEGLVRSDAVQAAVEAARDGVLVLAAVNASTARAAALATEMGADPYDVAEALLAVVEQRLVRRLCPECTRTSSLPRELPAGLGRAELCFPVFESAGCQACRRIGYKGRTGLFSVLEVDESIAPVIRRAGSADDIVRAARQAGAQTIADAIVRALREGVTSIAEVQRVFGRG